MNITLNQYDQHAAELTAAAQRIEDAQTRQGVNNYLVTVARSKRAEYIRAARDCLHWARIDRAAGDMLAAAWWIDSAARHRQHAAEWAARYNRVMARAACGEV